MFAGVLLATVELWHVHAVPMIESKHSLRKLDRSITCRPTKQFLHMLFRIGHCGTRHHKAEVIVIAVIAKPPQASQDKSSMTPKHAPA